MNRKAVVLVLVLLLCVGAALAETGTVSVTGVYGQSEARSMLDMINRFRTGADAWYWNSEDTEKVVCENLQPMVYDYDLEKVAMQRAIEIALRFSHDRPDGRNCFTAYSLASGSYRSKGENIAGGYRTAASAFTAWQENNVRYEGQGHRRNMLSSYLNAVGIGHVVFDGIHYWVQEFGKTSEPATGATAAVDGQREMQVTLDYSLIDRVALSCGDGGLALEYGNSASLPTVCEASLVEGLYNFPLEMAVDWTVADGAVARIEGDRLIALAVGNTALKGSIFGKDTSVSVKVNPASIQGAEVVLSQTDITYSGAAQTPGVTVRCSGRTLVDGADYAVTCSDNVNAGTATLTVTGKGNYVGAVTKTFAIAPASLKGAVIAPIAEATYTGSAIEPDVRVTLGDRVLSGDDYTLTYRNNTKAGQARVTATGRGNYAGTVSAAFTIAPANLATACRVEAIPTQRYTGKAIEPAVRVTHGARKLKLNRDYRLTFADNVEPGVAAVAVEGLGNYTGFVAAAFEIDEVVDGKYKHETGWYRLSGNALIFVKPLKSQKTVTIPDALTVKGKTMKVTAIDDGAFRKDGKLARLTIGKHVKRLGANAFAGCIHLTTVRGGASLTTIGAGAFMGCTALKAVTLPKGVSEIGKKAFKDCKALKSIDIKTTKLRGDRVGSYAFKGISAKAVFQCPKKQLASYRTLMLQKGAPKTARFQ